ncbi:MAG: beta-phosphoglucomutase [Planctomycetes bacterium]|jgi:beta-phosphoglucomutase|nr:beta-phosphoglucomutase [Phycisphaerae bacterium]NBB95512.1 beta-phosphoglucomutase [Planctomycetota bacterium]
MSIDAVIFDLDGVIVSTDDYHYQAWQALADEEGIDFDREINNRLRGVSRMESLDILLERSRRDYSEEEKATLAKRKNDAYRASLNNLAPEDILPGVMPLLTELRRRGVKLAIGSSSRNAPRILEGVGLGDFFDAVADGNDITRSKPDPQVFGLAGQRLGAEPQQCLVVEDAEAGVEAGLAAGMKVLAVGHAADDPRATAGAPDLAAITAEDLLKL